MGFRPSRGLPTYFIWAPACIKRDHIPYLYDPWSPALSNASDRFETTAIQAAPAAVAPSPPQTLPVILPVKHPVMIPKHFSFLFLCFPVLLITGCAAAHIPFSAGSSPSPSCKVSARSSHKTSLLRDCIPTHSASHYSSPAPLQISAHDHRAVSLYAVP